MPYRNSNEYLEQSKQIAYEFGIVAAVNLLTISFRRRINSI